MDTPEPLDRFDPEERYARARLGEIVREQKHTLSSIARMMHASFLATPASRSRVRRRRISSFDLCACRPFSRGCLRRPPFGTQ